MIRQDNAFPIPHFTKIQNAGSSTEKNPFNRWRQVFKHTSAKTDCSPQGVFVVDFPYVKLYYTTPSLFYNTLLLISDPPVQPVSALCSFCVPELICGVGTVLVLCERGMKGGGGRGPIRAESRWTI